MATMKLACLMVLCMVMAAPYAEAVLTCNQVQNALLPCVGYLAGGPLSAQCCGGIRSLNAAANTTTNRQAVCGCLKRAASAYGNPANIKVAASLPGKCGVSFPYKISTNVDCSKIK